MRTEAFMRIPKDSEYIMDEKEGNLALHVNRLAGGYADSPAKWASA
jgi:hypothetical protein